MKTSTKFATLAFGATSLIALVIAPASAQTAGGSKCAQFRDMDKTKKCLTVATDPIKDKEADLKRDGDRVRSSAYFATYTDKEGNIVRTKVRSDGSSSWIKINPKTGDGTIEIVNKNGGGSYNTFHAYGGSGGKRSTN